MSQYKYKKYLCNFLGLYVVLISNNLSGANEVNSDGLVVQHIIPAYDKFKKSTQQLSKAIERQCTTNDKKINNHISKHYKKVSLDWAGLEHIRFGPISYLQRYERIRYWPDKHNVGSRQIRKLLETDLNSISIEQFSQKSVAVQGLSALEKILFSNDLVMSNQKCELAALIMTNLEKVANDIYSAWTDEPILFKNEFKLAGTGEGSYSSTNEANSILINNLSIQLRFISDLKLGRALYIDNEGKNKLNLRKLESWRSEMTLYLLQKNISTLNKYYSITFASSQQQQQSRIHLDISRHFYNSKALITSLINHITLQKQTNNTNTNDSLISEKIITLLKLLQKETLSIDYLVRQKLTQKLGLKLQFNALDGD